MITMSKESAKELISIAQAAARFHVAPATIHGWIARKEISVSRRQLGKVRTFVDAREIERKLRPAPESGAEGNEG